MKRTEFDKCLDNNPFDWDLRLVYADWLEERGLLLKAAAQRCMAQNEFSPTKINSNTWKILDKTFISRRTAEAFLTTQLERLGIIDNAGGIIQESSIGDAPF